MHLIGYEDDINIMGKIKRAISEVYEELKESANEVQHNIRVKKERKKKKKQWYEIEEEE